MKDQYERSVKTIARCFYVIEEHWSSGLFLESFPGKI